jgi:hypothetical protein
MNLLRCEYCGTITLRRGASLRGAKCSSCAGPLLAPALGEDEVRGRLYKPPRYVERIERATLPAPAVLREAAPRSRPKAAA